MRHYVSLINHFQKHFHASFRAPPSPHLKHLSLSLKKIKSPLRKTWKIRFLIPCPIWFTNQMNNQNLLKLIQILLKLFRRVGHVKTPLLHHDLKFLMSILIFKPSCPCLVYFINTPQSTPMISSSVLICDKRQRLFQPLFLPTIKMQSSPCSNPPLYCGPLMKNISSREIQILNFSKALTNPINQGLFLGI